ncbi:MAG: hypothetical protein AB1634_17825, partial [Thermodesulfobacteriota bacterium]
PPPQAPQRPADNPFERILRQPAPEQPGPEEAVPPDVEDLLKNLPESDDPARDLEEILRNALQGTLDSQGGQ